MPTRLDGLSDETRDELARLAQGLANNAKTRKGFLGLIKEASPQTPIPEIDEVRAVDAEIAQRDKRIDELESKFNNHFLNAQLADTKKSVREKFGLSDDDLSKMEKMMTEKQLPADYNWAAQLYRQQTESASPTTFGGSGGYGPFDVERNAKSLEGLMDDTDNWASRTAHQMIDEVQKKGRSPAF